MIFIIIVCLIIASGIGLLVIDSFIKNRGYGVSSKVRKQLSWPSKEILKLYNQLPVDSRPDQDIVYMLRALDTKHEVSKVNTHFYEYGYDVGKQTWNCKCKQFSYRSNYDEDCFMNEYHEIREGIVGIIAAREAQKHALEVAGVENGLNDADSLIKRLREEKQFIIEVTSELI
jgi:hypothetical protein